MSESKPAGMPAIDTPLGEIKIIGTVHGVALNCLVVRYREPSDWEMKQFMTQGEFDDYVRAEKLLVVNIVKEE